MEGERRPAVGPDPGSVLAVFKGDAQKPVGHVKVGENQSSLTFSIVTPSAFGGLPQVGDLPEGGVCKIVFADYGDLKIRAAVDPASGGSSELRDKLRAEERMQRSLFVLVGIQDSPEWIIRNRPTEIEILPRDVASIDEDKRPGGYALIRIPRDENAPSAIARHLNRIARGQNVLKVGTDQSQEVMRGSASAPESADRVDVLVETRRFKGKTDKVGTPVTDANPVFQSGEWIGWVLTNRGGASADVTLLFVDNEFKLDLIYPRDHQFNRLPARFDADRDRPDSSDGEDRQGPNAW